MRRWLCFIMLLINIPNHAGADIRRWDALPAIEVMHLQGPYAGQEVCPMCRHGYDSGVLLFIPATSAPENAGRVAQAMQSTVADINDPRFRAFLILTGAAPSKELLAAVKSTHSNWYVAHLSTQALPASSSDFNLSLQGKSIGFVFSQRRLLWTFNPEDATSLWAKTATKYADYAMTFLHANYVTAVKSVDPDTPKGRLWLAPTKLTTAIALTKSQNGIKFRTCVSDSSTLHRSDALIALTSDGSVLPNQTWWARTDKMGCFALSGVENGRQLHAEIFSVLQAAVTIRIDGRDLKSDKVLEIKLPSNREAEVTGKEVIVGLPCEGCADAFQGLPTDLDASTSLIPASELGERLLISGVVKNAAGIPQANVIIYAYQTNRLGKYPLLPLHSRVTTRHGRLRGWVQTDHAGRYRFNTIRPGGYPHGDIPQHVHLHIIEPGRCTYYLGDVLFNDDPRLTTALRLKARNAYGGSGIVKAEGGKHAGWRVIRNITLGLNVPGYGECGHSAHAGTNATR